ncbi:hypothetical protein MNV49_000301 [Pseudohyphozyma bogoriensis]|nr:hypothetical protein MNV49_000301 [Pseudohyphozyma bogoriensis]
MSAVSFTIGEPIPFGLDGAGLDSLEVVSTECVTQAEIDWLDLNAKEVGSSDGADRRALVGIAPVVFDEGHALLGLAISTATRCLFIDFHSWRTNPHFANLTCSLIYPQILTSPTILLVGFDFVKSALEIRRDLQHDICGIDVSSVLPDAEPKLPAMTVASVFNRGRKGFDGLNKLWAFNSPKGEEEDHGAKWGALRAWLALACARHPSRKEYVMKARELDTRRIGQEQVAFFVKAQRIADRLEGLKPRITKAEFTSANFSSSRGGEIELRNSKFSTQIRKDSSQFIRITTADGRRINDAKAVKHSGKSTVIQTGGAGDAEMVVTEFEVVGRASGTLSDFQWEKYLREALMGTISVYDSEHEPGSTVLVTGPPGTGKTSVISASVQTWLLQRPSPSNSCIYCVTSSNVAAKNIAESLASSGFAKFRLLVSRDFFEEWHEHRYDLGKNLITTGQLPPTLEMTELEDLMGGVRVIISTLAMLSSTNLVQNSFFATFPLSTLLVDEASQIRIDQYPHVFDRFRRTLERVAFFGDAKQLAPYQSAQVPEIASVFDVAHLKAGAYFLDTQYRMPSKIGDFIGKHVYSGQLKSFQGVSQEQDCIKLVDVASGFEESCGTSTRNLGELNVVIQLVQRYYANTSFKILTPYDAQRNEIETALKKANLPWEDRVFNVDSFQGQEDEVILVSIVKTQRLGFLTEIRRSNVMLTRLKKAMVIVSNRAFLQSQAKHTLLGKLSAHLSNSSAWVSERDCLSGKAQLPHAGKPSDIPSVMADSLTWSSTGGVEEQVSRLSIQESAGWESSEWDKVDEDVGRYRAYRSGEGWGTEAEARSKSSSPVTVGGW